MRALVATEHGTYELDLDAEEVLGLAEAAPQREPVEPSLPLLLAADARGPTVVAVVDRRPPLMVSHDAGTTWHESGGGLPAGRDVAIHPDDPDVVLYAARNRLFLSRDGGTFWHALAPELPEIHGVAFSEAELAAGDHDG